MTLTVGVIGGLGPAATLDFFAKILARTDARTDQEHLHLIIDNNPHVPNRNEAIAGTGPSPGPALAASAVSLERSGADFIVMVCNTAHAWQADIEAAITVPFLSLIDETADAVTERGNLSAVGVLATSGCLGAELYQGAFTSRGVRCLTLSADGLSEFMSLVYAIKAGDVGAGSRSRMRALALALREQGAEVLVAACTEIPLVLDADDLDFPMVSSTDILVESTLARAGARWA